MASQDSTTSSHWPTVMLISGASLSLTTFLHEGTHAVVCLLLGGDLQEFSALHVLCSSSSSLSARVVSASASLINILFGFILLRFLRRCPGSRPHMRYFLWLFMCMNFFKGAGYWMFSGIANVGDWARVIRGLEPVWAYRGGMAIIGVVTFMLFVRLALVEWGKLVGGSEFSEQIRRSAVMLFQAYVASVLVVICAAAMNPHGLAGLPAIAGTIAVAGALSPFLWMMQWFRSEAFPKMTGIPLQLSAHLRWIVASAAVIVFYAIVLGRTIYF